MFKISFHGYFTFILDFIKGKHFFCISGIQNGFEKAKYIVCFFKNAFDSRADVRGWLWGP